MNCKYCGAEIILNIEQTIIEDTCETCQDLFTRNHEFEKTFEEKTGKKRPGGEALKHPIDETIIFEGPLDKMKHKILCAKSDDCPICKIFKENKKDV